MAGAVPTPLQWRHGPAVPADGTHSDLVFDAGELLLRLGQLRVGLLQGLPLGGHVAVDLVEADDVDAPGAQARGGRGLGADELGVERRVALVGPGAGQRALRTQTSRQPRPASSSASIPAPAPITSNRMASIFNFFFFFCILVITERRRMKLGILASGVEFGG